MTISKQQAIPKISVIMSVYNGMQYLKQAVKSILNQTYKNFEFIIVNDASTDSTPKYLKSLKDKRIRIVNNKKNVGLAMSLNKALKAAKGDYIARMDADDVSYPTRLELQLKYLLKNPNTDICGCWADLVEEKGKLIGEKKYPKSPKAIYNTLPCYPCIIHPTFFAKKGFFTALNGYDAGFEMAEDYDLLMRARKKFEMANVDKKLFAWRLWADRRSRKEMRLMDKVDLKIKIAAIKRDGFELNSALMLAKRLFLIYSIPYPIKLKVAKLLKTA